MQCRRKVQSHSYPILCGRQTESGVSAVSWSAASATTSCRTDFWPTLAKLGAWLSGWIPVSPDPWSVQFCIHPWLSNEDNWCSSFPHTTNKEPLEHRTYPFFLWSYCISCRFCILGTQFSSSPLQLSDEKHCKSSKKPGPKNQSSSVDAVKPIKERSSPGIILRGKSST